MCECFMRIRCIFRCRSVDARGFLDIAAIRRNRPQTLGRFPIMMVAVVMRIGHHGAVPVRLLSVPTRLQPELESRALIPPDLERWPRGSRCCHGAVPAPGAAVAMPVGRVIPARPRRAPLAAAQARPGSGGRLGPEKSAPGWPGGARLRVRTACQCDGPDYSSIRAP